MRQWITAHPTQSLVIGATLLVFLCYGNILAAPFVFDDTGIVGEVGVVPTFSTIFSAWHYFPARFIPYSTFLLNYWIGDTNPVGYHLINVLLHVGTTLTVYWFVSLIGKSPGVRQHGWIPNRWFAVAIAAIYAVHPLQTQAVTYVYQRSAVLAALFFLLSLCFLLRRLWWWSLLCAGLAMLSKENAFVLLPVALLTQILFDPLTLRKKQTAWYLFALALITVGLALVIGNHSYQNRPARTLVALVTDNTRKNPQYALQYVLTQIPVAATYLRLLFFPLGQNIDYDYPLVGSLAQFPYLPFLLHGSIIATAAILVRKNRLILYGVLFFYMTIAPESSIIAMDDLIFEHRLYLPSVGIFLAAIAGVTSISISIPAKRRRGIGLFGIFLTIVVILIILTIRRNTLWRDPAALWRDTVSKSPGKARAHYNLAVLYDRNNQLPQALSEYKAGLQIRPLHAESLINMGLVLERMGKFEEAEKSYVLAHAADPKSDALPLLNLGTLYMKQNKMDLALLTFEELVKLQPKHPFAIYNLGLIYETLNQKDKAAEMYKKARDAASGNPKQLAVIEEREKNRALYYQYQDASQGPKLPP